MITRKATVRRGFCPLCFRGDSCTVARVPRNSPCIDEEQRLFSRLPLLDLSTQGERCQTSRCTLICLVCGNPTLFPCEQEYEQALDAVEQYEDEILELQQEVMDGMRGLLASIGANMMRDAYRRLERRLHRMDLAWHPRWCKIVHPSCVRKESCGCVLTAGADGCKEHPVKKARAITRRPPKAVQSKPAMPKDPPQTQNNATNKRSISMVHCTWIPKPSSTVAIQMPQVAQSIVNKPIQKTKPQPPKPNPRLVQAAKGCQRIDNEWHKKGDKNHPHDLRLPGSSSRPPFDLAKYYKEFDPFLHGYFRKNGVDLFRFPDGWVEQVFSPVNQLTEDGRLVPG